MDVDLFLLFFLSQWDGVEGGKYVTHRDIRVRQLCHAGITIQNI